MRPVLEEDCPSPTISALSSKSRTNVCIVLKAGFSSLVQALTRSALRSVSVKDVDETSEGTEEKRAVSLLEVPRGTNAVETPKKDATATNDDSDRMIDSIVFNVMLF